MLKETEAEETTVFFVTYYFVVTFFVKFLSWVAFQLGGPWAPVVTHMT